MNQTNEGLLANGGKQLRPALALLMARACGGCCNEHTIRFAAATELLHNATLLHDDVADESDERRGSPTLRKMMGPTVSVLVGDFWLVRSMKAILSSPVARDRAVDLFAGTLDSLAEGEMLQLQKADSGDTVFEDYLKIIYNKTASLFVTACLTAAMSVSSSPEYEEAARKFGEYLGYAFQMRDDIFDYLPSAGIGKPVGVDIMEQKITLPLLCALDNVTEKESREVRSWIKDVTPEVRDRILAFVRANGGICTAQEVLEQYSEKAIRSLDPLPASKDKEFLVKLATYTAIRTK